MDKAFVDSCRADYCRADVFDPKFDEAMDQLKKQPARSGGGIDPDIFGVRRWGMFRYHVYIPRFDELMERLKK